MDAGVETAVDPAAAVGTEANLSLCAAGLNAHSQITNNGGVDVRSFIRITEEPAHLLFASWSTTAFLTGDRLLGLGHQELDIILDPGIAGNLIDAFGDHNGLRGCLSTSGNLFLLSPTRELINQSADDSPRIGHLALASNNKIAITFKQAPNGRLCHIIQFNSLSEFVSWFHNPSGVKVDAERQHFMMQGRPHQLVASTGTFMVLMKGGEVLTWGDPRYQSLGRGIVGSEEGDGEVVPAEKPGLVDAVSGLRIKKVACGGWMCAALSEDCALYVWGTGLPGTDQTIKILRDVGAGEVALVEIPGEVGEPLDITDVGVGDNHIAVVAEDKRLFVVGDNTNGQLGLGSDQQFFDIWTEVPPTSSNKPFRRVICGPKATFVFTDK